MIGRFSILLLTLSSLSSCGQVSECKPGTLYLTVALDDASAAATKLDIAVAYGGMTKHGFVSRPGTASIGTIEVDFADDYPAGLMGTVTVTAFGGGTQFGSASHDVTFSGDCQPVTVDFHQAPDGGVDLGPGCSESSCAAGATCVDGVCCDTPCDGQCEACNVPGSVGTCVAVSGAPKGDRAACAAAGATCGGVCDGAYRIACAYPDTATSCVPQSCIGGTKTVAVGCDGSGNCPAPQTIECTPATCNATGTDCASSCGNDTDCAAFPAKPYCDHGACAAKKPVGRACIASSECGRGFCVDGVCCDQACQGQCQACDITPGTCAPVVSGQPHNLPQSGRSACTGSGVCGGSCAAGQTQVCSYPSVKCAGGTCVSDTVTAAVNCNNGSCPGTTPQPCAGHLACGATTCLPGPCAADTDCAAGFFCGVGGVCTAQLPQGNACPSTNCLGQSNCDQCAAGSCVDGVCCDRACNGQCEACNLAGKLGVCSTVAAGKTPVAPRTACTGTAPCAGLCNGSDATACHFPTVACGPGQSCSGGAVTLPSSCKNGSCVAPVPPTQTCSGVCTGTGCGNCATDPDCGSGKYCNAGACVPTLAPSSVCSRNTQCASSFCVDGFCCQTGCAGACQNCSANPGTCTFTGTASTPIQPITDATTTRAACPGNGICEQACNGSGASCVAVATGTTCTAPTCNASTNVATLPASCVAAGTCPTPTTKACAPYKCNGGLTACLSQCSQDADCLAGNYCQNPGSSGVCLPTVGNGGGCGVGNQCTSGMCVGGVCCNSLCNGGCGSCGTGTCSPLGAGTHCGGTVGMACEQACNGSSVSCPSTNGNACGPHGCSKCSGGSCPTVLSCGTQCCPNGFCCGTNQCCGAGEMCVSGSCQ